MLGASEDGDLRDKDERELPVICNGRGPCDTRVIRSNATDTTLLMENDVVEGE